MTIDDLKTGEIVRHPERGNGIGRRAADGGVCVAFINPDGYLCFDKDLTGWERVETVKFGHVQVRVDDIADTLVSVWGSHSERDGDFAQWRLCARVAKAIQAQRDQATSHVEG